MSEYSLIDLLWRMKRGELLLEDYGICYHLTMYCADYRERKQAKEWMQEWMQEWPEYSGNELYPVPAAVVYVGSDAVWEAGIAYAEAEAGKWTGEYGAARKRLLNYLITRYEASVHA